MSLSILIPTVESRAKLFAELYIELCRQAEPYGDDVEILYECDDKVIPIGTKRNLLLWRATKRHCVFFDDDDEPYPHYLADIMEALKEDPDCVGQVIDMTTNGRNPQTCVHSWENKEWRSGKPGEKFHYYRNVTHRNPVRTALARQVGFPDLRFGEDKVYSDGVTKLCRTEVMIERPAFLYRYSTAEEHNAKYGIR